MRRNERQITDQSELEAILDCALVARLGMIDGDRPYVLPLNFAREGSVVWIHCAGEGLKLSCLRANSQVCIEVDQLHCIEMGPSACSDWTSRYESVIGFGRAEVVEEDADKRQGLVALMRKYSGRADWDFGPQSVSTVTVVRVRLTSLTGKRSPAAR